MHIYVFTSSLTHFSEISFWILTDWLVTTLVVICNVKCNKCLNWYLRRSLSTKAVLFELAHLIIDCLHVCIVSAGSLSAHRHFYDYNLELCCIVVDSGFSFTHIIPYCRGRKMKDGICRLVDCTWFRVRICKVSCLATLLMIGCSRFHRVNVGGKLLTNHLKEIISYR